MSKQVIYEEYVAALSNNQLKTMYLTTNIDPPQYPLALPIWQRLMMKFWIKLPK